MSGVPVPLILGHNQFTGVDHLSAERGRRHARQFENLRSIVDLLRHALNEGVQGLMASTHDRIREVIPLIEGSRTLSQSLRMYPIVPYAQWYVSRSNQFGLVRTLSKALRRAPLSQKISMAARLGTGFLRQDVYSMLSLLIDAELSLFRNLKVDGVFLHNVLTDLLLGWGAKDALRYFVEYVEKKYRTRAGFATLNFPLFVNRASEWGLEKPLVVTSFNEVGFQMNPSRQACEQALHESEADVIAMSIYAAGFLSPARAVAYVNENPRIQSVVFGASSPDHISETARLLRAETRG